MSYHDINIIIWFKWKRRWKRWKCWYIHFWSSCNFASTKKWTVMHLFERFQKCPIWYKLLLELNCTSCWIKMVCHSFHCIQLIAIITQFKLLWHYIQHCDNSGRKLIRFQNHNNTPYLALTGELRGVYCEDFAENWPCYNSAAFDFLHLCCNMCPFIYLCGSPKYSGLCRI